MIKLFIAVIATVYDTHLYLKKYHICNVQLYIKQVCYCRLIYHLRSLFKMYAPGTHAIGQNRSRVFWLPGNNHSFECVTVNNA